MSTTLDRVAKQNFALLTSHVDEYGAQAAEHRAFLEQAAAGRVFDAPNASLAFLKERIGGQALLCAFNTSFLRLALTFLVASALVVFMRGAPVARPDSSAH
jgi:hypothetical protein